MRVRTRPINYNSLVDFKVFLSPLRSAWAVSREYCPYCWRRGRTLGSLDSSLLLDSCRPPPFVQRVPGPTQESLSRFILLFRTRLERISQEWHFCCPNSCWCDPPYANQTAAQVCRGDLRFGTRWHGSPEQGPSKKRSAPHSWTRPCTGDAVSDDP